MSRKFRQNLVDELLIIKAQQGCRDSMSQLIKRWHKQLLQYAFKVTRNEHLAHDIVQETWVTVIKKITSLQEINRFRPWVLRILNNNCRDHWRKEETYQQHITQHQTQTNTSQAKRGRQTESEFFDEIMQQLDGPSRAILIMKYVHEMSIHEIAKSLNIPPGTAKSRLYHARNKFKHQFERN
ncbi:RNA polymerase sigma factor [Poriferisphaera corsica]|uniref:RNA polymerase sigma factor n=1 Tax=Poriferisphaera corsica TaxID=2528020 RepID=UPI0011A17DFB|nr:RNA polymerase sigma factor [Poriferisphaera corsica]